MLARQEKLFCFLFGRVYSYKKMQTCFLPSANSAKKYFIKPFSFAVGERHVYLRCLDKKKPRTIRYTVLHIGGRRIFSANVHEKHKVCLQSQKNNFVKGRYACIYFLLRDYFYTSAFSAVLFGSMFSTPRGKRKSAVAFQQKRKPCYY